MLEEAIGFGRMAARFVDEKREEFRREHERRRPLLGEGRVQRGFGIVAIATRARDEVQMLDVLPAALTHEARVVTAGRLAARLHGEH